MASRESGGIPPLHGVQVLAARSSVMLVPLAGQGISYKVNSSSMPRKAPLRLRRQAGRGEQDRHLRPLDDGARGVDHLRSAGPCMREAMFTVGPKSFCRAFAARQGPSCRPIFCTRSSLPRAATASSSSRPSPGRRRAGCGCSADRAVRDKALDWCGRRRLGSLAQVGEGRFRLWQQTVPRMRIAQSDRACGLQAGAGRRSRFSAGCGRGGVSPLASQ
jgi:hypothetical protein